MRISMSLMKFIAFLEVCLFVLFLSGFSQEAAVSGWYVEQSLAGEYKPLGLLLDTKMYYEFPLINSEDMLFKSSKVDAGVINRLSPAFEAAGLTGFIEPIAFFDFTLTATYQYCFNGLGYGFLPEDNPDADYSPAAQANVPTQNQAGWWVVAAPRLKMQIGNFIAADTYSYNYMNKFNFSGYYYETYADIIIKGNDYYWMNDGYFFYQFSKPFLLGINYYNVNVPGTGYVSQRLSAVAVFEPDMKPFSDLYAILFVGTYLEDHYYTGRLFIILDIGYKLRVF